MRYLSPALVVVAILAANVAATPEHFPETQRRNYGLLALGVVVAYGIYLFLDLVVRASAADNGAQD
jgi:hypothetical protein